MKNLQVHTFAAYAFQRDSAARRAPLMAEIPGNSMDDLYRLELVDIGVRPHTGWDHCEGCALIVQLSDQ